MKILFTLVAFWLSMPAFSCDLTYITLDSVVAVGPNHRIYFTACIGGGNTGGVPGGTGNTLNLMITLQGTTPVSIVSYTPFRFSGDTTGGILSSFFTPLVFPAPQVFADGGMVITGVDYRDTTFGAEPAFVCDDPLPSCGLIHAQCMQFMVEVDAIPDTLKFWGGEAGGNIYAGCSPMDDMFDPGTPPGTPLNKDMVITDFTNPFPLAYTRLGAKYVGRQIQFDWKIDSDEPYFPVELQQYTHTILEPGHGKTTHNGTQWIKVAEGINGVTITPDPLHPPVYRLKTKTYSGSQHYSRAITIYPGQTNAKFAKAYFSSDGSLRVEASTPKDLSGTIEVVDVLGRSMYNSSIELTEGANVLEINNLPERANQLYIIHMQAGDLQWTAKAYR